MYECKVLFILNKIQQFKEKVILCSLKKLKFVLNII